MASYNPISDHPPPSPQSHDEEELSDQSEVGKHKQKTPHVKPQFQGNRKFNAQKATVPPPEYSSDAGEEEKVDEDKGEENDESENCPHSPSASVFTIKRNNSPAKPTFKDSKSTSKCPSANKDDEKGLGSKKKAKFNADQLKKDKPSSVSAATAGMVWSDEQVINLLQCMIEFKAKKGVDADADPAAFHEFFEREFQFRYSKSRVYEKIRRLKMKYCNNLKKFEKVGKDTAISKVELETLNLSRKISSGRAGAGDFESKYPLLSQSFDVDSRGTMTFAGKTAHELSFLKENMHLIGDDKAKELEQKWKTLHAVFLFKSLELMKEQTGLVLELGSHDETEVEVASSPLYKVERKIGEGSLGQVCKGRLFSCEKGSGPEEVAPKFEHKNKLVGLIKDDYPTEWHVYNSLGGGGGTHGVPTVHYKGKKGNYFIVVVELDFLYPSEGVHELLDKGYRITSIAATSYQVAVILSKPKSELG